MYETLTPRWAIFLMGIIAGILGIVPFVAFYKGPEIRKRSKYSKILMEEERKRVEEAEMNQRKEEEMELGDEREKSTEEKEHSQRKVRLGNEVMAGKSENGVGGLKKERAGEEVKVP